MEFEELGEKERKLLLEAIDIDWKNMKCEYCGNKTDYKSCSIMPNLKKRGTTILCNSILCLTEYLGKLEEYEKGQEKIKYNCVKCNKNKLNGTIVEGNFICNDCIENRR